MAREKRGRDPNLSSLWEVCNTDSLRLEVGSGSKEVPYLPPIDFLARHLKICAGKVSEELVNCRFQ